MKKFNTILARHYFCTKTMQSVVKIKSSLSRNYIQIPLILNDKTGEMVLDSAIYYLQNKGFTIVGYGELQNEFIVLVEEFKSIK